MAAPNGNLPADADADVIGRYATDGREITMMMWYGDGMDGWGYGLMLAGMIVFWALIVLAIVALVRYAGRPETFGAAPRPGPSPQQILAERFARGEIDDEEYNRRMSVLGSGNRRSERRKENGA